MNAGRIAGQPAAQYSKGRSSGRQLLCRGQEGFLVYWAGDLTDLQGLKQRFRSITQTALAGNGVDPAEEVAGFVHPDIEAQGCYAGPYRLWHYSIYRFEFFSTHFQSQLGKEKSKSIQLIDYLFSEDLLR
jgi:hypothetical protein